MSGVFSGGLVYEYSEEGNKYGLVQINGNSVQELDDFKALQSAYSAQKDPSGDGGYKTNGAASNCPAQSSNWAVSNDNLPALPSPAKKYLSDGAGKGAGLTGAGSQNAGTGSSATASSGSGAVASTAPANPSASAKKASASSLRGPELTIAPIVCTLVVLFSSVLGMALL